VSPRMKEADVPRIIVQSDATETEEGAVLLAERVSASHLETDHSCAQLIERLGWAVLDAEEIERRPGA
jgi:hypothetical protein